MSDTFNFETPPENIAPVAQLEPIKPIKTRKKRSTKHDFKDGLGRMPAHRHANGKGWVADTAVVEDSVYVGPRCQVYNNAYVAGKVRIEGRGRVSGKATVSGNVIIKQDAHVYGNAVVRDETIVADNAVITGHAHVSGRSRLFNRAVVQDSAQVISCTLRDAVRVYNVSLLIRSSLSGHAEFRNNCVVVNSIVDGHVIVDEFAQVLGNSALRNNHRTNTTPIHITDNAIIADNTHIWYPIEFRRHAVAVRCNLSAGNGLPSDQIIVSDNTVLHHRRFSGHAELTQFLELIRQQPAQMLNGQNNNRGPQIAAVPQVRQINYLETSAPVRRVQRLQEAGA